MRFVVLATLGLTAAACSSTTDAPGGCVNNDDCAAGQVCESPECIDLCVVNGDCSAGLVCVSGTCRAASGEPPSINGVDGTGVTDGAMGHTDHHVTTHLVILGQNLSGSSVVLEELGGGSPISPTLCEEADTRLMVELPDTLAATDYQLTVTNQAGSCAAALPILRGTDGTDGATGPTGPMPVVSSGQGLLGDGTMGSPVRVDFAGTGASTVARGDHTHVGLAEQQDALSYNCTGQDGLLFYDNTLAELFVCSGGAARLISAPRTAGYGVFPSNPGLDCLDIRNTAGGSPSGFYWIDSNGGAVTDAFRVYCDMVTEMGGWTRFNWIHATPPAHGFDPLGSLLRDCDPEALNCYGRIPLQTNPPSELLVKNISSGDYAIWSFDGSTLANGALSALRDKTTANLTSGPNWQPTTNVGTSFHCGNTGGTCSAACDVFLYDGSEMTLNDDTGYCCAGFKSGDSNSTTSASDHGYLTEACEDSVSFGDLYYR